MEDRRMSTVKKNRRRRRGGGEGGEEKKKKKKKKEEEQKTRVAQLGLSFVKGSRADKVKPVGIKSLFQMSMQYRHKLQ
jgi:hypothetical protein